MILSPYFVCDQESRHKWWMGTVSFPESKINVIKINAQLCFQGITVAWSPMVRDHFLGHSALRLLLFEKWILCHGRIWAHAPDEQLWDIWWAYNTHQSIKTRKEHQILQEVTWIFLICQHAHPRHRVFRDLGLED